MSYFNLIRRFVKKKIDSSESTQLVQAEISDGEIRSDIECVEPFGFTSCPPDSVSEGVALFINGDSDNGLVIGWLDKTLRIKDLKKGEFCLYSEKGSTITGFNDGKIVIEANNSTVTVDNEVKVESMGSLMKVGSTIDLIPIGGVVNLIGTLNIAGGLIMSGAGGAGGVAQITGSIETTGDVKAGSISLQGHSHAQNNGNDWGGGVNTGVAQ